MRRRKRKRRSNIILRDWQWEREKQLSAGGHMRNRVGRRMVGGRDIKKNGAIDIRQNPDIMKTVKTNKKENYPFCSSNFVLPVFLGIFLLVLSSISLVL